jgi:DNA gyrase subunit A
MDTGTIRKINIDTEMQASYLDYAMSVIVARALPDVRDGLKPVHRRILWAMYDLGLTPDKPYKKSARIVGEVLGKYHPHGDVAVYEAMVRMAQDFSLRYPLVDGQGNFGSIDGDNAAAMRYTEARLAPVAMEMLTDIEKDTVEWGDNFDGTLKEPNVLPAALPNLLVNGASGIAVGMSTNIPPHNLNEVCDALSYLIDNYDKHEDVTNEDLMRFIPGPDFPTGGVVYRYAHAGGSGSAEEEREDAIAMAYASGKGSIVLQAKAHIEEMSRSKNRIVITELPYQTNKSSLLERIAELVRDGRLEGLTDLRDESDRTGMRISIELTRTVDAKRILADLFKLTPLQQTFGMSLLALQDGEPKLLSLKRMLLAYIDHRREVIRRRAEHDLAKAKARAHILEGLLKALDILDEVIALIRASRTADVARDGLVRQFGFTEIQAQAILDMQLRRLAALERRKLQDEYKEILVLIKELEALLKSPRKILDVIKQDLNKLKTKYGDARRTQIADRAKGALTTMDLLPDEEVWLTLNTDGSMARYRRERDTNGRAKPAGLPFTPGSTVFAVSANTRTDLYLFTSRGQVSRLAAHQIPEGSGPHFADLFGLSRRDRIAALVAAPKQNGEPLAGYLVLATVQGKAKRVSLADLASATQGAAQVIGLDEGDQVIWAGLSAGGGEIMLFSSQGQANRFREDDVRAMGMAAGGVGGLKLAAKDRVVASAVVGPAGAPADGAIAEGTPAGTPAADMPQVALFTRAGFAKRVPLAEFPIQGRNGQGVTAAKVSPKTGEVATAALMDAGMQAVLVLPMGAASVIAYSALTETSRSAAGRQMVTVPAGQAIERVYVVSAGKPEDGGPGDDTNKIARAAKAPDASRSKTAEQAAKTTTAKPAATRASAASAETAAPEPARRTRKPPAEAAPPAAPPQATGEPAQRTRKPAAAEPPKRARKAAAAGASPAAPAQPAPAAQAAPAKQAAGTKAKTPAAQQPARPPSAAAPKSSAGAQGRKVVVDAAQLALLPENAPPAGPEKKKPKAASTPAAAPQPAPKPAPAKKAAKPAAPTAKTQPAPVQAPKPKPASDTAPKASGKTVKRKTG